MVSVPGEVCKQALRSAGGECRPVRLIRKERYNTLCEADRSPRMIVGGNRGLENANSIAAMLHEDNSDVPRTSKPYIVLGILL